MLKFFRQLRYQIIESGKTSRYLKYAIGEIILVVLGILIALQINNWNEQNNTKQRVLEQLVVLGSNVEEELTQLEDLKTELEKTLQASDILSKQFQGIQPIDQKSTGYIVQLLFEQNLYTNDAAFEKLTDTNGLVILPGDLQQLISKYYIAVEQVKEREEISNSFIKKSYEGHYFSRYSMYNRKGNTHELLQKFYEKDQRPAVGVDTAYIANDRILETMVFGRSFQSQKQMEAYENAILQASQLLLKITNYLDEMS